MSLFCCTVLDFKDLQRKATGVCCIEHWGRTESSVFPVSFGAWVMIRSMPRHCRPRWRNTSCRPWRCIRCPAFPFNKHRFVMISSVWTGCSCFTNPTVSVVVFQSHKNQVPSLACFALNIGRWGTLCVFERSWEGLWPGTLRRDFMRLVW